MMNVNNISSPQAMLIPKKVGLAGSFAQKYQSPQKKYEWFIYILIKYLTFYA